MKFRLGAACLAVVILALVRPNASAESDPEIDRLIKKLPAPEKLVKPDERVFRMTDAAMRDPLLKEIAQASRAKQFKRGMELTRQLSARYPASASAHAMHGLYAEALHHDDEAIAAFRKAVALQPKFTLCHFGIAAAEYKRGHYAAALPHIRRVTELEPQAASGWAVRSMCAQAVGQRQEGLTAAQRLITLAPQQPAAWVRLAEAQRSVGNYAEASRALNRAVHIARAAKAAATKKKA